MTPAHRGCALQHQAIPSPSDAGRWLVVAQHHDHWSAVLDCPSEATARAEAIRRSPIVMPAPLLLRAEPRTTESVQ